jgi:hypothetical protein
MSSEVLGPMFHGSLAELKSGDTISPAKQNGRESKHTTADTSVAYATDSVHVAEKMAIMSTKMEPGQELTGHVYKVEPLDVNDIDVEPEKHKVLHNALTGGNVPGGSEIKSKTGFRVIKHLGSTTYSL